MPADSSADESSNQMRDRETLAHHSRAVVGGKRRSSKWQKDGEDELLTKRRNVAGTQTGNLTPKPNPSLKLPFSGSWEHRRYFSSSSGKRKRRNSYSDGRKWVFSPSHPSHLQDKVVVVSYNILGVENALKHPDLYRNVPIRCLDWERRKYLITKEIGRYNAGILCLQEVDRFNDLDELLQKNGFRGVYKSRTGDASDGCAVFWKHKLFTLLHHEAIEFQNFGLRNNVAQFCILKMNSRESESKVQLNSSQCHVTSTKSILVGNIHVLFNPNRGDIKLGQVRLFLDKAYKLLQEWGDIPVIIAGDLNSVPESAVYEFIASSKLDVQLHDRRKISGQLEYEFKGTSSRLSAASVPMYLPKAVKYSWSVEELRVATGSEATSHARHSLELCSAYNRVRGSSDTRDCFGEPLVTSYHSRFMGTVDYIWHSGDLLPVRVLETVPIDILKRSPGLPNERWGSDHLALACEFAIADKNLERGRKLSRGD